jgi:uncharacterized repeat protein (TIGR01451 family)
LKIIASLLKSSKAIKTNLGFIKSNIKMGKRGSDKIGDFFLKILFYSRYRWYYTVLRGLINLLRRMVMKKILLALLLAFWMLIGACQQAPMPLSTQCEPPKPISPPPAVTNAAARIYPSEGAGVVKLEKIMPSRVQTGAEFEYKIRVTNLANCALTDVVVTDTLSGSIQYKTSNPQANVQGNNLVWFFTGLGPKETKEITVVAIAAGGGTVQSCADVTYRMPLCMQTVSIQPNVAVTIAAPVEVSICSLINYTIRIENTGTGPANNVKVIDQLPSGLITTQGSSRIEVPIGALPAGAARSISVTVKAQNSGTFINSAVALADGNINVQSPQVTTVVKQPVLDVTKTGPDVQYLEKEIAYDITVKNIGDWPAFNTLIEDEIPAGVTFVKASQGGVLIGNKVMWKIAKLNPGAMAKISVAYMPKNIGTVVDTVRASAICADAVAAAAKTEVKGVSAVLLEVIDLADPIKIGNTTTYRIMVTNQGSVAATNIAVKAMLEPQMEYVSGVGATNGALAADTVTFAPLPSLAPKSRATWEVTVRAKALGDVRFKTVIKCDQLDREVMETESTHFYE